MKIIAPRPSLDFTVKDLHGEEFSLSDYRGKAVILSFFRNTSCPFCLKRVFDLSVYQQRWRKKGVEVITVFTSPQKQIINYHKTKFTRFRVIPDPSLNIYKQYGIEKSFAGFIKGLVLRLPTILQGFKSGAKIDKNNPHGLILPADFLIDPNGQIVEAWYGRNAADNIPIDDIEYFVRNMAMQKIKNVDQQHQP